MDAQEILLRAVTIVLSSLGIVVSLLAIFIRTLVSPSYVKASASQTALRPPPVIGALRPRIAHRFQLSASAPVLSSYSHSDISKNTARNNIVDGTVPYIRGPALMTESCTPRFNSTEVSIEIYKVPKIPAILSSPSIEAHRIVASPALKQRSASLRGRSSMGSLLRFSIKDSLCLKNHNHSSYPPLRTQPYAAPYFFPAPGTPEAIDYVRKTREELLLPYRTLRRFTQED